MDQLNTYFFSHYRFRVEAKRFKQLIYLFVILKCLVLLCQYSLLFGTNQVIYTSGANVDFPKSLAFILYNNSYEALPMIFLIVAMALSLVALWRQDLNVLPDLLIWFTMLNLNFRMYAALTGGDNLLVQLLFFNIFLVNPGNSHLNVNPAPLKIFVHNLSGLAIMIQICLVYLVSAIAKLTDEAWIGGEAVGIISRVEHFAVYRTDFGTGWFHVFLNYLVLAYQLLFPVLVWFRKVKKPFLILGILMHVYISAVMGLFLFGLIMIICYAIFWQSETDGTPENAPA